MEPDRSFYLPGSRVACSRGALELYLRATRELRADARLLGREARMQWIADATIAMWRGGGFQHAS